MIVEAGWRAWSRQQWGTENPFADPSLLGEDCGCDDCDKTDSLAFGGHAIRDGLEQMAADVRNRPAPSYLDFPDPADNPRSFQSESAGSLLGTQHYVDIYLSAGFDEGDREAGSGGDYISCTPDQSGNCSLYRVRFDFWMARVAWVDKVLPTEDEFGWVQPAVSPDGTRIAVAGRLHHAGRASASNGSLTIIDSDGDPPGEEGIYYSASDEASWPYFPTWLNDSVLYFGIEENTEGTLVAIYPDVSGSSPWKFAGPGGTFNNDETYKDPEWSEAADKLVTFGVATEDLTPPQVSDALGGNIEPLELGQLSNGRDLKECHHPSWNPEGDGFLCTHTGDPEEVGETRLRQLYRFGQLGGEWESRGPLIAAPSEEELQDELRDVFPADEADGPNRLYTYKYAQWCGREDYVVAALMYSQLESDKEFKIEQSRVVLLRYDQSSGKVEAIWDLVSAVEEYERDLGKYAPHGSMRGHFSTCSTASVDVR